MWNEVLENRVEVIDIAAEYSINGENYPTNYPNERQRTVRK